MSIASVASSSSSSHTTLQNIQSAAELPELKRQYLALLPPTQVIDICLRFDSYALPFVKHTIWPASISTAIAALVPPPPLPPTRHTGVQSTPSTVEPEPLSAASPPLVRPDPLVPSEQQQTDLAELGQSSHVWSPSQSASSTSLSIPLQGFANDLDAIPSHPTYSGSDPAQPLAPNTFLLHPALSELPEDSQKLTPEPETDTEAPSQLLNSFGQASADTEGELPNYEEMIVNALVEFSDPEGSAPKTLYTWMETRYPLHNNFRPSASQALQKAFRKGRVEKSVEGKYRLNASWDGENNLRRTTRRPQTQSQTAHLSGYAGPKSSPFTTVPRAFPRKTTTPFVPANRTATKNGSTRSDAPDASMERLSTRAHHTSSSYEPPLERDQEQPLDPSRVPGPSSHSLGLNPTPRVSSPHPEQRTSSEGSEDWEAAQAIFKALGLLQMLSEGRDDNSNPNHRTSADVDMDDIMPYAPTDPGLISPVVAEARTELQTLFDSLALQLAEMSDLDDDEDESNGLHYGAVMAPAMSSQNDDRDPRVSRLAQESATTVTSDDLDVVLAAGSDSDSDDMEEVMFE